MSSAKKPRTGRGPGRDLRDLLADAAIVGDDVVARLDRADLLLSMVASSTEFDASTMTLEVNLSVLEDTVEDVRCAFDLLGSTQYSPPDSVDSDALRGQLNDLFEDRGFLADDSSFDTAVGSGVWGGVGQSGGGDGQDSDSDEDGGITGASVAEFVAVLVKDIRVRLSYLESARQALLGAGFNRGTDSLAGDMENAIAVVQSALDLVAALKRAIQGC